MKNIIRYLFPYKLLIFFTAIKKKKRKPFFLQNVNWNPNISDQKRVLISYVFGHLNEYSSNGHYGTRAQECSILINEFIAQGYCVDLIDYRDDVKKSNILNKRYDLLFGFGKPFSYVVNLKSSQKSILYLTEKYPAFSLKKELERIAYFKQRHNKTLKLTITFTNYVEEDFHKIDSIVYIGNPSEANLIPIAVPKYPIKPTGLINSNYVPKQRNIPKTKKRFLWFGSRGALHKGLDLLIDVFKEEIDCTLYICGLSQLDKKLLPKFEIYDNIEDLGFVDVQSDKFIDLINKCSYVIFPSCSEGISTGVITCMNHGLIPVVTQETGIILSNFGLILKDFQIDTIKKSVKKVSNYSDKLVLEQHNLVYDYALENYSLLNFQKTFSNFLKKTQKDGLIQLKTSADN